MIYFIAKYKVEGTINSSINDCTLYCKTKKVLGIDIETSLNNKYSSYQNKIYKGGLDPYLSNIVLIQIGDLKKQFVIDVRDYTKEELKPLTEFIHLNNDVTFVAHNGKFECKHLLHKYGIVFKKIHDTMLCEIILNNGLSLNLGLADLAVKYLNKKKANSFDLFNSSPKEITLDESDLQNEHSISPFDLAENKIIDKSTRLEFINIGSKSVTYKQIKYSADDIIDPILIAYKQREGRELHNGEVFLPKNSYNLEGRFTPLLAEMENFGLEINVDFWTSLGNKYTGKMYELEKELIQYVNKKHPKFAGQYNMFTGEVDCKIQWTSSNQVVSFFKYLEICPKAFSKQTGRLEYTVGAKELLKQIPLEYVERYSKLDKPKEVKNLDDFTLLYLVFKKYEQLSTTFGKEWLKYVHPLTGKVHPSYVQLVNTGRMACRAPNCQQISSSSGHRDAFTLKSDNEFLINADFSNMEVRVMADKANETMMLAFFNEGNEYFGDDLHSYTATLIERTKYNDDSLIVEPKELPDGGKNPKFTSDDSLKRTKSKETTFGLAFGKNAKSLAQDFRITEEEADEFMNDYYNTYPGLKKWFDSQHKFYNDNGYIVIDELLDFRWFNTDYIELQSKMKEIKQKFPKDYFKLDSEQRKLYRENELFVENPGFKDIWVNYYRQLSSWKRKSQNAPVQGQAAMINKTAGILMRNRFISEGVYIKYVNFTLNQHDEWVVHYVENDIITKEQVAEIVELCMAKAGGRYNKRIKHIGKAEVTKKWVH